MIEPRKTTVLETLKYVFDRIMEELVGPDFLVLIYMFFVYSLFRHGYFQNHNENLLNLLIGGFFTYFATRAKTQ